jgi:hypothetical protein
MFSMRSCFAVDILGRNGEGVSHEYRPPRFIDNSDDGCWSNRDTCARTANHGQCYLAPPPPPDCLLFHCVSGSREHRICQQHDEQRFEDLGLSAAAFGGAAGIFFIGYFFFEVPSNLVLNKFGARIWIARIMFTWGIVAGAQAFVVVRQASTSFVLCLASPRLAFFRVSSFS